MRGSPKIIYLGSIGLFLSLSTNIGTHNSQDQVSLYNLVMEGFGKG